MNRQMRWLNPGWTWSCLVLGLLLAACSEARPGGGSGGEADLGRETEGSLAGEGEGEGEGQPAGEGEGEEVEPVCDPAARPVCPRDPEQECQAVEPACTDGRWEDCPPAPRAGVEQCDGLDNDCDGLVDATGAEPAFCPPTEHAVGALCRQGRCELAGRCEAGYGDPDGVYANGCECRMSNLGIELCDGLDNNCNGQIDEGLTPPPASKQAGVCADARQICRGAQGWTEPKYEELDGYEAPEQTRDGLDNDCDGLVDPFGFTTDPSRFAVVAHYPLYQGLDAVTQAAMVELADMLRRPVALFIARFLEFVPLDLGVGLPTIEPGTVRGWLADAANSVVEPTFRENVGDETYERYLLAGETLVAMLEDLEVQSELTLEHTDRPEVQARILWQRLAVESAVFCETQFAGCERRELSVVGRAGLDGRAETTATWSPDGRFDVQPYDLHVDFATLINLLITRTLLPAILQAEGEVLPVELMAELVDCEGLTDNLLDWLANNLIALDPTVRNVLSALLQPALNGYCLAALEGWGSEVQLVLEGLAARTSRLQLDDQAFFTHPAGLGLFNGLEQGISDARWAFHQDPDADFHGPAFQGTFTGTLTP